MDRWSTSGDLLGARRRESPERGALHCLATGERLSYAELDERARACARLFASLGLEPGDRCAMIAGNRLELLDAFFAAGKSGVVFVPLNTRLSTREMAGILDDCSPKLVLYAGDQADAARALSARGVGRDGARFVALDDAAGHAGDPRYAELLAEASGGADAGCREVDGEALYALLYTSGTTGQPKGVMLPHRQLAFNAHNTARCWELSADDVTPVFVPLFHAGGLGALLTPIIASGGAVVLHERFDADEVLRAIEQQRCTVVLVVPTIAKMLLEAPGFAEADLSSLRWLISGGAPLPMELIAAYRERGLVLRQGYGLTEVGPNCFMSSSDDAWRRRGSVGQPMGGTEARLIDEQGREIAADDEGRAEGELCLRGPHVSLGYWRNPEATAAVLADDGWMRTGDVARRDADGFHTIVGRRKEIYISGGENVYPAEVEAQLREHPAVIDVAVIGVPDARWGEVGAAFVVADDDRAPLEASELSAFLDGRLARYKIPRRFVLVDDLPRTAYGKVLRGELAARLTDS